MRVIGLEVVSHIESRGKLVMKKYVILIGLVLAAILGSLIQLSVAIDPFFEQFRG